MANTIIFNGTEFKNATALKAEIRANVMAVVTEALRTTYGENNVAKVGSNEFGVIVGTVKDKDGFDNEVVVTVKPTVKEWESRKTAKKVYEQYILSEAAEIYEMETREKEEEKKKKEAEKEAKKERDKAERAKRKEAEVNK